ncbi:MAG: HD domain-containing protein [Candidatus Spechtbacterales bacterium]|nr:HD domain-containing protein [Candidatus Spechtbacterales bacterium]
MTCKPRTYKALPPFLTMKARQKKGTRVTVVRVFDVKTGQPLFQTYKGDMRGEFSGKKEVFGVFEVRAGIWKKITGKGERLTHAPREVINIAKEIKKAGGRALLVGGSVRDALLGIESKDFDIEVYGLETEEIETAINNLNPDHMDTVGRSFGVIKAKFGEHDLDISLPRRESKSGKGHRGFEIEGDPNMTPKEAAGRRDFTINTLAQDPLTGEIIDYFGGHKDLAKGVLRVTDEDKFREDPLRVLRGAQFAARFNMSVEERTMEIMQEMTKKEEFRNLPESRIGEEWRKLLLKGVKPSVGLEVGLHSGAFEVLHPELTSLKGVPQEYGWHPEGDVWEHTKMTADVAAEIINREGLEGDEALVIMLASLTHDIGKSETTEFTEGRWRAKGHAKAGEVLAKEFLKKLEVGRDIEKKVSKLVKEHMFLSGIDNEPTDRAVDRLAERLQPAKIEELVLVMEADRRGRGTEYTKEEEIKNLLHKASERNVQSSAPVALIGGKHLIKYLNKKPGPSFGKVLRQVYEAQLDGRVNNIDDALKMASDLFEQIPQAITGN